MKREERQVDDGSKARDITGKKAKDPVYRAVTTDEDGITTELNSQETMIPVIAESNQIRQQQ